MTISGRDGVSQSYRQPNVPPMRASQVSAWNSRGAWHSGNTARREPSPEPPLGGWHSGRPRPRPAVARMSPLRGARRPVPFQLRRRHQTSAPISNLRLRWAHEDHEDLAELRQRPGRRRDDLELHVRPGVPAKQALPGTAPRRLVIKCVPRPPPRNSHPTETATLCPICPVSTDIS